MFDFSRQALLSSLKRIILFISISYFCEFSHFSVPAMYDLRERKGQGSNDMEKYEWDLSSLVQLLHGKKKNLLDSILQLFLAIIAI